MPKATSVRRHTRVESEEPLPSKSVKAPVGPDVENTAENRRSSGDWLFEIGLGNFFECVARLQDGDDAAIRRGVNTASRPDR